MNISKDRRSALRIELKSIIRVCRQCDIASSSSGVDLDITIINISPTGMKFRINARQDINRIEINDNIFIRGCIFNYSIGFLSSQKAVAIWKKINMVGVEFTPALEVDDALLRAMISK